MSGTPGRAASDPVPVVERMNAIAAQLRAVGLTACVHETRGVLDVTATLRPPGCREIELTVEDDGFVQVSWWSPANATSGQITATVASVLAAITDLDVRPG
jgi:hypothetical protein